jgi:hypothetical protein
VTASCSKFDFESTELAKAAIAVRVRIWAYLREPELFGRDVDNSAEGGRSRMAQGHVAETTRCMSHDEGTGAPQHGAH